MNDKLKKVIELANQLQNAVDQLEEGCVLAVNIYRKGDTLPSGIHIYRPDRYDLDGLMFDNQDDSGDRWFHTDSYGVRVYGSVIGGDGQ